MLGSLHILKQRKEFLACNSGARKATPGFVLQGRDRRDQTEMIRVGFTCSKKLGNAVTRNRAKRRLRALAQSLLPELAEPGWDYVLIGRPEATVNRQFAEMEADLRRALTGLHR
ncbi:MAG: ribonuclease P protein component [Pseudomonadota bacterium]